MDHVVVVPTLNAAKDWAEFAAALLRCVSPSQVLIVDSESTDGTPELARQAGFSLAEIARKDFNHGRTRQMAAQSLPAAEIVIYMTQDAILAEPGSLTKLLAGFEDSSVGVAFGRQLPRRQAGPIETHSRLFNYPAKSAKRSLESRVEFGFKSIFVSNSFAAYRRHALDSVGGFPDNIILGEDTITAARLMLAGWKIAYVAEAQVCHSHEYSWRDEFRRYFDTGVLHARESWLIDEFGTTSGEGLRFLRSEMKYLGFKHVALIPSALLRTAAKLIGYRLGRMESRLSVASKRKFSMHGNFWIE
jgi:rhamnosyltransferase